MQRRGYTEEEKSRMAQPAEGRKQMQENKKSYSLLPYFLHANHLKLPAPVGHIATSAPASGHEKALCVVVCFIPGLRMRPRRWTSLLLLLLRGADPNGDGLELAPPTRPDAEDSHEGDAGELEAPPEPVGWNGMRVQRRREQVEEVDGEGKVGDEFGARDEEQEEYYTGRD
jgi:hypothetical protein